MGSFFMPMTLSNSDPSNDDQDAIKCDAALRKLANFCNSYKPDEIDDLNSDLLIALVGQNYSNYTNRTKERLLDFFEAVEEVLPALFDLHDHIRSISEGMPQRTTFEQEIAYRNLFSLLKSQKS